MMFRERCTISAHAGGRGVVEWPQGCGRTAANRRTLPPPPCVTFRRVVVSLRGPWTVTRSPLRMLRRVAAFCRPLRPVLLLVSFPHSRIRRKTRGAIVGKNEVYRWENLIGPFLGRTLLGPRPPPLLRAQRVCALRHFVSITEVFTPSPPFFPCGRPGGGGGGRGQQQFCVSKFDLQFQAPSI